VYRANANSGVVAGTGVADGNEKALLEAYPSLRATSGESGSRRAGPCGLGVKSHSHGATQCETLQEAEEMAQDLLKCLI